MKISIISPEIKEISQRRFEKILARRKYQSNKQKLEARKKLVMKNEIGYKNKLSNKLTVKMEENTLENSEDSAARCHLWNISTNFANGLINSVIYSRIAFIFVGLFRTKFMIFFRFR